MTHELINTAGGAIGVGVGLLSLNILKRQKLTALQIIANMTLAAAIKLAIDLAFGRL